MEDLTEIEIAALRGALEALVVSLTAQLDQSADGARPVDLDLPIGRLSRMDAMQQQKMVAETRARAQRRRAQVRGALVAMDAGRYGECQRCEEPIGLGRLRVRPETMICLGCQASAELRRN